MEKKTCKRCGKELEPAVSYQCCRCFTIYCARCEGSGDGKKCPECGMGARLVLSREDRKEDAPDAK